VLYRLALDIRRCAVAARRAISTAAVIAVDHAGLREVAIAREGDDRVAMEWTKPSRLIGRLGRACF
jgi:hypothetical protein